jgi:GNAT superfamily N-acetyltransferase
MGARSGTESEAHKAGRCIVVRRGTTGDVHKAGRLWLAMVAELAPEFTPNVGWWRSMAASHLKSGHYAMFVAEDLGSRMVGFIDLFLYPEPATGKVHAVGQHFYLVPAARRTRAAWALYNAAERFAREKKAEVMELFCFDNEKAMWARKGYSPLRTLMRKEISHV